MAMAAGMDWREAAAFWQSHAESAKRVRNMAWAGFCQAKDAL
jgi:hypothetical protein